MGIIKPPILVVEDDGVDVAKIKKALQQVNLTNPIYVVGNGSDALEWLRSSDFPQPGLILLDLNMPKMSGLEFLEQLRSDNSLKNIPVVVLTTSDEDTHKTQAFQAHVAGYIVKPVSEKTFMDALTAFGQYWMLNQLPRQ